MKKIFNKIKCFKTLSKKKKRIIALIAAGCLLVLAACYTVFIAPLLEKEQWVYKEETVERGTLKIGVSESGSLEYGISSILYDLDLSVTTGNDEDSDEEDSSDDSSDDSSEEVIQKYLKIEEVYVAAGQRIEEGDILFKFTEDSVFDVRRLLESAVVDARAEYADAQSEYNLSALEAQTDYEGQQLEGEYAGTIYKNASRSVANEIKEIQIQITQAQANTASLQEKVTEAQENYEEAAEAYEEAKSTFSGIDMSNTVNYMILQKEFLNAETQYNNAKSSLNRATQNLEENAAEIISLQKELRLAEAKKALEKLDVEQAYQESLHNGENAEITYNATIESLEETLQEAEDEMAKVEEQLEAYEAFVGSDGCVYADGAGIVTEVAYEAGDRLKSAGVLVSYATPGDMTISVDVTQEDIVDLIVGDKVDIAFTAYEDTSYEGSILSINTTATSENSNTVSYTVVIGVEGDTSMLYGGMTADIIFVTEQKEDVLYISRKAIVEEDGKTYVYCKTALGGRELKQVETGISNGVDIEIVSGLEEGDIIYLASRVSSEEEVKSSAEESSGTENTGFGQGGGNMPGGGSFGGNFSGGMPGGSK